ncbi:MAG: protein kinase [Myxococcota bacterium]
MAESGGEQFGRYELLRRIAFGGMAEIFLASFRRDEGFEKRVVLKRILPQYGADPAFTQMFIDEAVVAARLTHPNVVQVYDFGNVDGVYFIAMEYVDGIDLRRVLKDGAGRRQMAPAEVAALGEHVARGLAYAHSTTDDAGAPLGIVHRDVSPQNIMISRSGEAKIMDFGIAIAAARATKTATGTIKGKVAYMAPEQAAGHSVDKRCDQFALGLVLWECLSGERMFGGDSDLEVLRKVAACDVRPLKPLRPDVDDRLDDLVARALKPTPEERYDDLSQLADELAAFRFSLGAAGAVRLGALVPAGATASTMRRTQAIPDVVPMSSSSATPEHAEPPAAGWVAPETAATVATVTSGPVSDSAAAADTAAVSGPSAAAAGVEPGRTSSAHEPRRTGSPTRSSFMRFTWRFGSIWLSVGGAGLVVAVGITVAMVAAMQRGRHRQPAVTTGVAVPSADPATATLHISSQPPGARILLAGLETGLRTPASVPGLRLGTRVAVTLALDGYEQWTGNVDPATTHERVEARMVALPIDQGRLLPPAAKAIAEAVAPAPEADGAADSASAAAVRELPSRRRPPWSKPAKSRQRVRKGVGRLWLRSTGAWVDVYLGGKHLGTTPLSGVKVPAGRYELRLVNEAANIEQKVRIDVAPDSEVRKTVSPK